MRLVVRQHMTHMLIGSMMQSLLVTPLFHVLQIQPSRHGIARVLALVPEPYNNIQTMFFVLLQPKRIGLGGEVFIWDIEAALASIAKSSQHVEDEVAAKGNKESVYALAMNRGGNLLVFGGTEKVIRVWDPRTGSKNMKLRGHSENIRALLLDSTGR